MNSRVEVNQVYPNVINTVDYIDDNGTRRILPHISSEESRHQSFTYLRILHEDGDYYLVPLETVTIISMGNGTFDQALIQHINNFHAEAYKMNILYEVDINTRMTQAGFTSRGPLRDENQEDEDIRVRRLIGRDTERASVRSDDTPF